MSKTATPQRSADRSAISVLVDGRACTVPAGASVAAALELAAAATAGIGIARRSVQGMPRGPFCGMGICQECRVSIDGRPHRLACQILCAPGMVVLTPAAPAHQGE